jgi:ElaB/YqjD/DUF883 family membrane-anchored ribosome-binding protein
MEVIMAQETKDAKQVAQDAAEVAAAKAKEARAAAEPTVEAVMEKLRPVVEFIKKNPALAAKVGAAMLPILLGMLKKKKESKDS